MILLIAYPVYFFSSNFKKYTKERKSAELLIHTVILFVIVAVLGGIWAIPEIVAPFIPQKPEPTSEATPVESQEMSPEIPQEESYETPPETSPAESQPITIEKLMELWKKNLPASSTFRWIIVVTIFTFLAWLLGHEHGNNRWLRSVLTIVAMIALGWLVNFWMGILFLSVPMIAVYYSALRDLALIVMPASNPEDKVEQKKRINAFISYAWGTQSPMTVVNDHAWKKYDPRIPGDITWNFSEFPLPLINKLDRPGVVWTRSHQTVAISGGTQFKRIENPGISFTGRLERLDQVFDLRTQLRSREIEVVSKDGIRFIARYFTAFRIDNENWIEETYSKLRALNLNLRGANRLSYTQGSFPFSHLRVQATLGVTSTKVSEGTPLIYWDQWVMNVIEDQTRKVISQKNLDEMWRPANDYKFANAMDVIADEIKGNAEMTLRVAGILLFVARVVNFSFPTKKDSEDSAQDKKSEDDAPYKKKDEAKEKNDEAAKQKKKKELDEISRQQIATWGSEWERRRHSILAEAEAEAERAQQEARAYAESLLLNSIAEGLQKTHEINPELPRHVIAMRFLSSLQDYVHKELEEEEEEEGPGQSSEKKKREKLSRYLQEWQEMYFSSRGVEK